MQKPDVPKCDQMAPDVNCPQRLLLDEIMDKWSVFILTVLNKEPLRFNEIRRRLNGVTQKALTQSLRRLERNGLLAREVLPVSPIAVEYRITPLGRDLQTPFMALYAWTNNHLTEVELARQHFDRRRAS